MLFAAFWVSCIFLGSDISSDDMYIPMAVVSMMSSCCPSIAPNEPSDFVSSHVISSTHRRSRSMYSRSRMIARDVSYARYLVRLLVCHPYFTGAPSMVRSGSDDRAYKLSYVSAISLSTVKKWSPSYMVSSFFLSFVSRVLDSITSRALSYHVAICAAFHASMSWSMCPM